MSGYAKSGHLSSQLTRAKSTYFTVTMESAPTFREVRSLEVAKEKRASRRGQLTKAK